jgi:predicted nucleotidyltransferase component of viral defense system
MIKTAQQLKGLVRNISQGDSTKAQEIMVSYAIERLLERISLSPYRDNLLLKGGTLVAAMIGASNRATMDIDTTIKNLPLSEENARKIIDDLITIELEDNMSFKVKSVEPIMDEADYPGIRVMMEASLEKIRIPFKIDFSTDDVITPSEVSYSFKLLFENRTIPLLAYNLETMLAEKMQTIISRGIANTRMRDFYDIHALLVAYDQGIDQEILRNAFYNTSAKRGTETDNATIESILETIRNNSRIIGLWNTYRNKFSYASHIEWEMITASVDRAFFLIKQEPK